MLLDPVLSHALPVQCLEGPLAATADNVRKSAKASWDLMLQYFKAFNLCICRDWVLVIRIVSHKDISPTILNRPIKQLDVVRELCIDQLHILLKAGVLFDE